METSLGITGLKKLQDYLDGVSEKLEDWSGIGPEIETIVREDFLLKFQSSPATEIGGTIWGDQYWRPLEEGYLAARPDRRGGQILIDTQNLMKAYTQKGYYGGYSEITEDTMEFGVDSEIIPHAEKLEGKFPLSFWHPVLLEKISDRIARWYLERSDRP